MIADVAVVTTLRSNVSDPVAKYEMQNNKMKDKEMMSVTLKTLGNVR